jgi:hypothetical protein
VLYKSLKDPLVIIAFLTAMMPFWTMTLGRLIFAEGHIVVPYRNIATLAGGLVVPLMVNS